MGEANANGNLHAITPPKTDAVIAQELRDQLRPLLEQICAKMDRSRAEGMQLGWSITMNGFGKSVISEITVMKLL